MREIARADCIVTEHRLCVVLKFRYAELPLSPETQSQTFIGLSENRKEA